MTDRMVLVVGAGLALLVVGVVGLLDSGGSSTVPVRRVVREAPVSDAPYDPDTDAPVDEALANSAVPRRESDTTSTSDEPAIGPDEFVRALTERLEADGWVLSQVRIEQPVLRLEAPLESEEDVLALCETAALATVDLIGETRLTLVTVRGAGLDPVGAGLVRLDPACTLVEPDE